MKKSIAFRARSCQPGNGVVFLLLAVLITIASLLTATSIAFGQSAISLLRFSATGRTNHILVEWETATEFNNAGFFVWASDLEDGVYNPISDFIEATGDGVTGAIYSFIDIDVEPGIVKFYKLEAIELNQNSEFFGPVSGVFYLSTPSATSTLTRTPTATLPVTASATATLTRTAQVQSGPPNSTTPVNNSSTSTTPPAPSLPSNQSAYPGQETATQTNTPAFNYLGTPYLPVPSPTPQPAYPDQVSTPTTSHTEMPMGDTTNVSTPTQPPSLGTAQVQEVAKEPQEIGRGSSGKGLDLPPYTALLVVLLIWALLAGWFYLSIRHLD